MVTITKQGGPKRLAKMIIPLQGSAEKELEAIPELLRVGITALLQGECEQTGNRNGHANGYKPKTVRTRTGKITFVVAQVREGGFYPSAVERGLRRERPPGEVSYLYVDAGYEKMRAAGAPW